MPRIPRPAKAILAVGLSLTAATGWVPETDSTARPVIPIEQTARQAKQPCGLELPATDQRTLESLLSLIGLQCPRVPVSPATEDSDQALFVVDAENCASMFTQRAEDDEQVFSDNLEGPLKRVADQDDSGPVGHRADLAHGDNREGSTMAIGLDPTITDLGRLLEFIRSQHQQGCQDYKTAANS